MSFVGRLVKDWRTKREIKKLLEYDSALFLADQALQLNYRLLRDDPKVEVDVPHAKYVALIVNRALRVQADLDSNLETYGARAERSTAWHLIVFSNTLRSYEGFRETILSVGNSVRAQFESRAGLNYNLW